MSIKATSTAVSLEADILRAIEQEASRVQERCIREAVETYERELRKAVGNGAIEIARYFEMQYDRGRLVITVLHKDVKP